MVSAPPASLTSGPRIVVIEDSAPLRENLILSLTASGKLAWGCASAEAFYRDCVGRRPHIVVVDIGLPGEDGLRVIEHLHQVREFGIIVATAQGSDESIRSATGAGADYYFVKPVKLPQLLAAIDSLWRRLPHQANSQTARRWLLDLLTPSLTPPDRAAIPLTPSEAALLTCLSATAGLIISKDEICAYVFGDSLPERHAHLDVLVSRLRSKVKSQGYALPLRSIFGKGLAFVEPIWRG
jgi:two-component system response regulator PhoP